MAGNQQDERKGRWCGLSGLACSKSGIVYQVGRLDCSKETIRTACCAPGNSSFMVYGRILSLNGPAIFRRNEIACIAHLNSNIALSAWLCESGVGRVSKENMRCLRF